MDLWDERALVAVLVLIGIGASFAVTVVLFGFVVMAAALVAVIGLGLLAAPGKRRAAGSLLAMAGVVAAGPVIYVSLALMT